MEIIYSMIGIAIGIFIMWVFGKIREKDIERKHANEINALKEKQHQAIKSAQKKSVQTSRNVLRGKVAEQMAPMLGGFDYTPSDARFLGDPIDYVVFNGYSNLRDNGEGADNLEIVILDVKSGKARLQKEQKAIEKAINAGRVRFETVRVSEEGKVTKKRQKREPTPTTEIKAPQEAQKNYPRTHKKWITKEIKFLVEKYQQGASITALAEKIQRDPTEVTKKLQELEKLSK